MTLQLRQYQIDAIQQLRTGLLNGFQSQLLVAPTGSGKTLVACEMIRSAVAKQTKVSFIADRNALVDQTSARLFEEGIEHGVTMGSRSFGRYQPVQVCSAQTLEKREFITGTKLIIIDEAHTQRKKTLEMVRGLNIPFIGLTATPFAKGLGEIYKRVVNVNTTNSLIHQKFLVPLRVYCAHEIDMTGVPTSAGEWKASDVESRALPVVGDVVTEWVKYTSKIFKQPVKTLVFSATVTHGEELCKQFQRAGYIFEQISYKSDYKTRKKSIDKFREGEITGLISVDALAKGFDVPDALCLCVARPFRNSLTAHIQMLGRIMRPSPGKEFGLVLDHASNYVRFATATEGFFERGISELNDKKIKELRKTFNHKDKGERKCFQCQFVLPEGATRCPACGYFKEKKSKANFRVAYGRMQEYKSLCDQFPDIWNHLCAVAQERHPYDEEKARRFALAQHKNITGYWPKKGFDFDPYDEPDPRISAAVEVSLRDYIKGKIKETYKMK